MSGRFSNYVLGRFGAPKLGELTECNADEMDDPPNYLNSFVLNSIFVVSWQDPLGRLLLMFGRRVEQAIHEYRNGREILEVYVKSLPQTNNHFLHAMRATAHFEQCIASTCQAVAFRKRIVALMHSDTSLPEDDCEKRLKHIWNRSKHFDEDLANPLVVSAEITAPVWLTNSGIESTRATISYTELASVLKDLIKDLKFFSEDFPKQVSDTRESDV